MNKLSQTTPQVQTPPPPPAYSDRQFLHTFLAGALLPFVQASITAFMVGIGTMTLLSLFNAVHLLKPSLIVASIVWVLTWLYLQRRWLNLTSFERITGIDLNGDGQIGKPSKEREQLVIRLDEITADKHYRSRTIDSVISKDKLTILARGLLNGIPFTERSWTGEGKLLSINEFRAVRSMWIKLSLLEVVSDKDNRQGFDFTEQGWAVMEKLAGPVAEAEEEDDTSGFTDEELKAIDDETARYANQ